MNLVVPEPSAYRRGLFRYVILEPILSRPPEPGELAARLREIAEKEHVQAWDKRRVKISMRTLERWYSKCRKSPFPVQALQPKLREDRNRSRVVSDEQKRWLCSYNLKFPSWSVQLLYDNLCEEKFKDSHPSYSSVLRYCRNSGILTKTTRSKNRNIKEIRSYEVEYVGQLWHMDFHLGSRMVLTENGEYRQPICMAIIDDKSRLVCHAQWFLNETAEVLVHGLCQAIAKRGMPATFFTDNGAAMKAAELVTGLEVLGIKQEYTLPYAAYQNGKQESFWKPLEGRLLKMIPREKRITLDTLNTLTQAWVEQDYHTTVHSETRETPLNRFFNEKNVLRNSLDFGEVRRSFRMRTKRTTRKTDGTITIDGVRFELPTCHRHLTEVLVRYARWDLGEAELLCAETLKPIAHLLPLNKLANSMGNRIIDEDRLKIVNQKVIEESDEILSISNDTLPPLLARCLQEHARANPIGGYLPLTKRKSEHDQS